MVDTDNVRDEIYPFLKHDINHHTKMIPIERWVDVILNVSPERLSLWTSLLRQKPIVLDPTIEENMQVYRDRSQGQDGYLPWSIITNRIVEVAHDYIPNLPAYKLKDLLFVRNDPIRVNDGSPYHSQRSPDVVVTLQNTLRSIPNSPTTADLFVEGRVPTEGITWYEVISCVEFRQGDTKSAFETWEGTVKAVRLEPKSTQTRRSSKAKVRGPPHGGDPRRVHTLPLLPSDSTLQPRSRSKKRKATGLASAPASKRLKTGVARHSKALVEDDPSDAVEQTAMHALELLASTSGTRSHCLQMIVDGSDFQVWYYDAGGMICSSSMCWMTEFEKFAAIIIAFASLDLADWGIRRIPNLTPPELAPAFPLRSLKGYSLSMDPPTKVDGEQSGSRKVTLTLGKEIYTQYSLVGRRTTVYEIDDALEVTTDPLILKMSMQTTCRIPEYELIKDARDKGVGNLPEIHMCTAKETEWRLSDGVWGKLFPDNNNDEEYGDRCQHLIVFTKYKELKHVISPANMHSVFAQLIQCLHDLRYKAKILHRDISLGNLMCKTSKDSDSVTLILNDFDVATYVGEDGLPVKGNLSEQRIGTLPFMAVDILENLTTNRHYLRHDLESVFWVALWCLVKLPYSKDKNEEKRRQEMLLNLEQGGLGAVCDAKFKILQKEKTFLALTLTPEMRCYGEWIGAFRDIIEEGYDLVKKQGKAVRAAKAASKYTGAGNSRRMRRTGRTETIVNPFEVDQETLGGTITCDIIMDRLEEWEKLYSADVNNFLPYYF